MSLALDAARARPREAAIRDRSWRLGVAALVATGLLLPILTVWSVAFPPQHDSFNHLARHVLELQALLGLPLPPGYEVQWRVLPNLGGDIVIPPLIALFGPHVALKIFLSLAIVLHWLGPALFILQEGRWQPAAWVASLLLLPLLLSGTFFWGFLNYYSGVGLAFLAVVHLRALDRADRPTVPALGAHAALVALLFLWHLAALAIYVILLGCVALARLIEERRVGRRLMASLLRAGVLGLPLLPAIGLYLAYATVQDGPMTTNWLSPERKLVMLLSVFRGYDIRADAIAALLLAAGAILFFRRSWRRWRPGFAAWAALAFLAAYLVLPLQWRTTSGADARMLPALVACTLAALGTMPLRWSWAGLIVVALAAGVRSGDAALAWRRLDARLQDAARALPLIERGASVLPVSLTPDVSKEHPETHFPSLAVIERHAYVAGLFAFRDQQPLRLTGETRLASTDPTLRLAGRESEGVFRLSDPAAAAAYDYLWFYNPLSLELSLPVEWMPVFAGERTSLWRRTSPPH